MFVELTTKAGKKRLVNPDKIIYVVEDEQGTVIISVGSTFPVVVEETFEEVKKKLGLKITPRAETIMCTDSYVYR